LLFRVVYVFEFIEEQLDHRIERNGVLLLLVNAR
jgi:hypothetical protein